MTVGAHTCIYYMFYILYGKALKTHIMSVQGNSLSFVAVWPLNDYKELLYLNYKIQGRMST